MSSIQYPTLKNRHTGCVIEVNTNPFTIGRGLGCNFIVPSKVVSRVHCVLEKRADDSWVLDDTSTNGTFLNEVLVKLTKSAPLKNNDVISLDGSGTESYIFCKGNSSNEITDEQLCAIADAVLEEVDFFNSNSTSLGNSNAVSSTNEGLRDVSTSPVSDTAAVNPLQDHLYTAKSSEEVIKKPRLAKSPRTIFGGGGRRGSDSELHSSQHTSTDPSPSVVGMDTGSSRISPVTATVSEFVDSAVSDGVNPSLPNEGRGDVENRLRPNLVGTGDGISCGSSDGTEETIILPPQGDNNSSSRPMDFTEPRSNMENLRPLLEISSGGSRNRAEDTSLPGPSKEKRRKSSEKLKKKEAKVEPKVQEKDLQPDHYEVMENELQCVICSELFIKALTLNCSHTFCKYCITMWSKNKSDCPICRTKITSTTPTIVLDNVIEKVIEGSNEEIKNRRLSVLEERKKQEEAGKAPPANRTQPVRQVARRGRNATARGREGNTRRGRARGARTAGNRTQNVPRINVLDPVAINIGALINNVIEVSSESEWSSDTESMSPNDLDEYDNDDWYDTRRPYYGGYGYCFRCGSPTHWANSCPNR